MSHEIKNHDQVIATSRTWHGLERIVEPEVTKTFAGSPWDYPVLEQDLFDADGQKIEGYKHIVAPGLKSVNNVTLQVANASYGTVQNEALFEALEKGLTGIDYEITCLGTLKNRRRPFLSLSLKDKQDYLVNGDEFKAHINLLTSHDGSCSIRLADSNTRVVCANTFRVALAERGKSMNISIRHTSGASARVDGLADRIEQILLKRDEFFTSLEYLKSIEMSDADGRAFVVGHSVGKNIEDATERAKRPARDLIKAFRSGDGNKGETAYDMFNAYTQHWTRKAVVSNAYKNYVSSEFGGGADRKAVAYQTLVNDSKRLDTIEAGKKFLMNAC